jgi:hypothetical protein
VQHEITEPISPELVLVDPELAARVRATAVAGPSLPAPSPVLRPPAEQRAAGDAPARAEAPPRRRIRVTTAIAVLGGAALLGAAFLPPREAPRLTDVAPPATAAPARPAPTLSWRRTADADYYLVELLQGERLVHATTVRGTRLEAPEWLAPGRYTWRVFAGDGAPADRNVRGPLERGWFVLSR